MTTVSSGSETPTAPAEPIAFVDLGAQHAEISEQVVEAMGRVILDCSFINGSEVRTFEESWASYCGLARTVGVSSGTDALELALRALGVGPGDEVIVPTNSFFASAGAVARTGARPRFVDCDPVHLLMDPAQIAAVLTPRTRAVVPVHLYGQLAPMDEIHAAARAVDLLVVEDAAQAHGASQGGRRAGSWGAAAAFSFYPGKNLGAYGEAGAVGTNSEEVAQSVEALRNHGSRTRYEHPTLGFNSRLDTLQAVVLNAKLVQLDKWNSARRVAAARYDQMLGDVPGVMRPSTYDGNEHVWHLYVVRVPERNRVLAALHAAGVPAAIHYPTPIHLTGAFSHLAYIRGDFPVAEKAADEILSLPMHPHLSEAQQERVVEALAAALS
jgi:dTDP-4-amino-4,6-dideoxygalactose transaminase